MITFSELEHLSLGDTIFKLTEIWELSGLRLNIVDGLLVQEFTFKGQEMSVSGRSMWSIKKRLLECLKGLNGN